jgi:hypothetical protein
MNKTILEKLFIVLNILNIPYILIGGYAAAAWGYIRATKDTDFLAGIEIPVISPEDLIILKVIAGSPLDINDAQNIHEIVKDRLDMIYLAKEMKRCKQSLNSIRKKAEGDGQEVRLCKNIG